MLEQVLDFILNDLLTKVKEEVIANLNVIFILCYIGGGYIGKYIQIPFMKKLSNRGKTIILGTILSGIYAVIAHIEGNPIPLTHIFWSYLFATTICYDIVLRWIGKKFSNNPQGYTELTLKEKNSLELNLLDPDIIIYQTDEKKGFYRLNIDQTNWVYIGTKL